MISAFRDIILIVVGILKLEIVVPEMGAISLWGSMIFSLVAAVLLYIIVQILIK